MTPLRVLVPGTPARVAFDRETVEKAVGKDAEGFARFVGMEVLDAAKSMPLPPPDTDSAYWALEVRAKWTWQRREEEENDDDE